MFNELINKQKEDDNLNNDGKKRWIYLAMGTVILLFCSLIYGWSLFSQYFGELYPKWSLSQLSMAFTISMIGFCMGGLFAGIMSKKHRVRTILWISTTLIFVGFFGVSRMNTQNPELSLIILYVFYGCFAGFGVGIAYNVVISTVSKWFTDKSGAAIGTMMMGFGCGALILGSGLTVLIAKLGLFKTYLILGVGISLILIAGSFLLKAPTDESLSNDKVMTSEMETDKSASYVVRDPIFWVYMLWAVIVNTAGMIVIGNAASIAISAGAAAIVGMIVSVCNGAGRILVGALYDKLGRVKTMILSISTLIAAGGILVLGAVLDMMGLIIIGLVLMGLQYGGNPIIASSFVRGQYGAKYYSSNFAIVNFCAVPAAIIGPTVASVIVTKSGGDYIGTYFVMIACGVISVFVFFILNRMLKASANK